MNKCTLIDYFLVMTMGSVHQITTFSLNINSFEHIMWYEVEVVLF